MVVFFIFCSLLGGCYIYLISRIYHSWHDLDINAGDPINIPNVSVIVIARNEENNIQKCLSSIAANEYPTDKFEIILVDDHSQDNTVRCAEGLNIQNLRILKLSDFDLSGFNYFYKKAGQFYAIQKSKYDLILQTDADCFCTKDWINSMVKSSEANDLSTGIINLISHKGWMSDWQIFENIGIMAATSFGIQSNSWYSANAANMIYKKSVYHRYVAEVSNEYASGDDIFFVNWANKTNMNIGFVHEKGAEIITPAVKGFTELFQQRLRWATKTKAYDSNGLKWMMSGLFLFHLLMLCLLIFGALIDIRFLLIGGVMFVFKWLGDFILLSGIAPYFNARYSVIKSPIFSMLHVLYIVVFGMSGLIIKNYKWKGRDVS